MRQILTVFAYTFREGARKKAFVVSTVLIMALVLILCLLPAVIDAFSDDASAPVPELPDASVTEPLPNEVTSPDEPADDRLCYLIDDAGLIPGAAAALDGLHRTAVETVPSDRLEAVRAEIAEDADVAAVVIADAGDGTPFLTVITRDFMTTGLDASFVASLLSETYVASLLADRGIDAETIALARISLPYSSEIAGTIDLSGYILGIIVTMLVFFAIYYYGYGVAMSVATEKTSRVMETLIVSAKPSRILLGKCLGMGVLGLCQYGGILLFAAVCYTLFIPEDFLLLGMPLSLSAFTPSSALLMLVYFILGYALYATLNAVCGASVSKIEDLNSAMMPVMLMQMISFYVAYFVAISGSGEGIVQKIAMYVPFCSPFIMPFKLLNSDVSAASIAISIAGLLAAIVVVAWISIRIYSASVLHYGSRLKWKDAYKTKL